MRRLYEYDLYGPLDIENMSGNLVKQTRITTGNLERGYNVQGARSDVDPGMVEGPLSIAPAPKGGRGP